MEDDNDEVPPFVEFNRQHMNDNNDDCDDDLLSIAADDEQQHFGEPSVAHHKEEEEEEEDVTKQDLNDMKQMIHDMLLWISLMQLLFHVKMIAGKQWPHRYQYNQQLLTQQSSPHRYPIQHLDDGQLRVHLLLQHGRYLEEQLKVPCHSVKNVVIVQQKYQNYQLQ